MNDNNINNNIPKKVQPIAKTGASKPISVPPVAEPLKVDEADLFKAVYREQKIQNQQQTQEFVLSQKTVPQNKPVSPVMIPVADPEKNKKETEENKKFNIIFIVLIILTVVLFLVSTAFLVFKLLKTEDEVPGTITTIPVNTVSASLESPFNYQKVYEVTFPEGMKEEYKDLYAQNQDFVGWLTVPGTCIDTPVYYTHRSEQYYLKHDPYMQYTKYGVPYMDPECDPVNLSRNTSFHGHNFDDDLIFDELHNYKDPQFFIENPIIELSTLYADYKFKIIGAFHSNGSSVGDNDYLFYYIAAEFGNESMMKFYDEIQQRSYIHTGVDVQPTDKLITLSTCSYDFDRGGALQNVRFAVIGRMIRDGESEAIDPTLVTVNNNVRYPQLYYDVFGGTNPWVNSTKWVPESK